MRSVRDSSLFILSDRACLLGGPSGDGFEIANPEPDSWRNGLEVLLLIGVLAYGSSTATYLAALWTDRFAVVRAGNILFRLAIAYWTILMVYLGVTNAYTAGVRPWLWSSAWALGGIYIFLQHRYKISALGSFVAALSTLLATLALMDLQWSVCQRKPGRLVFANAYRPRVV